jgi:hypothetical protein
MGAGYPRQALRQEVGSEARANPREALRHREVGYIKAT